MSEWAEVVATSDDGRYRAVLMPDSDCTSPMDSSDLWITSVLVSGAGWGSPYSSGETYNDPEDRESAWRYFDERGLDADAAFIRYMRLFHGIEVREVSWGSNGDRALAWVEPTEADRVGLRGSENFDAIEDEVNEYNEWADGNCYGYVIQESVTWSRVEPKGSDSDYRETWEDTDVSCWGFIGYGYVESEALDALNNLANRQEV